MNCPHCHSSSTTEQEGRTVHGFRRFRCRECGRRFNERTGTALNRVQVPTDIVFLFWRLRYKLSLQRAIQPAGNREGATQRVNDGDGENGRVLKPETVKMAAVNGLGDKKIKML